MGCEVPSLVIMSAIFHNIRHWFANPEALWLLLALPILGLLGGWARRRRRRALALWESRSYFPPIFLSQIPRRIVTNAGLSVGLALLILGITGPQWGHELEPALVPGRDIVVLLDMSRSMLAQDVLGTSSPNRLGRARDGLLDLVNSVQQRGGHRLALVVFAARAAVVCPLTHDYNHFREALLQLEPDEPFLEIGPDAS
ncbi:MAG TPA: VWA domain-containing protein, partial [Gemmataceae bacterium]|nr:VWA domain-containing protein [Gemmataceae bacterium]